MAKILILGVGGSQANALEKMQKEIPDAKCVHLCKGAWPYWQPANATVQQIDMAAHSESHKIYTSNAIPSTYPSKEFYEVMKECEDYLKKLLK